MDIPSPKLYSLEDAKKELIRMADQEIIDRENALLQIRNENFEVLHEDEPAANWIKFVPILNAVLLIILIVIILAVIVPKLG